MARYDYTAVVRTLAILDSLGRSQRPPSLTEIARTLDLDPSTVHRLLTVLCESGFVQRLPEVRRYVLRFQPIHLGPSAVVVQGVARLVQPLLLNIVAEVGETTRLAALEGSDVRFWAEAGVYRPGSHMLGALIDAHASASGKVLLASRPRAEVEQLYRARTMRTYTQKTISNVGTLLTELGRVRRQGWAIADGELPTPGIRSLAVPCTTPTGKVLFALSISGPASQLPWSRRSAILTTLRRTAREIASTLGLHGADPFAGKVEEGSPRRKVRRRSLPQEASLRPIRLIVPFPAGGGTDALARQLAAEMSAALRQTIIIDNRTGGAGVIANEVAARAEPDGYTMLLGTTTTFSVTPHFKWNRPYRIDDFQPIGLVATASWVMLAGPRSGIKSCRDLVAAGRARPGKVSYAHAGKGSGAHLFGTMVASAMKVDLIDVPYRGEAPAYPDLANGAVDLMATTLNGIGLQLHRAGRLSILAVSSADRSPIAPEIETFAECGFPTLLATGWFGLFAPPKTPASIIERYSRAAIQTVSSPVLRARIEPGGFVPRASTPAELAAMLPVESKRWGEVIRRHNIQLDNDVE